MADDYTTLNSGTGGDSIDEEAISYGSAPTTRKRSRVVIGGDSAAALAKVTNVDPVSTDYGLVIRIVMPGQGDDATTVTGMMVQAKVNDTPSVLTADQLTPLSVTNDGRLRVASVDARIGTNFFNKDLEEFWGNKTMEDPPSPW